MNKLKLINLTTFALKFYEQLLEKVLECCIVQCTLFVIDLKCNIVLTSLLSTVLKQNYRLLLSNKLLSRNALSLPGKASSLSSIYMSSTMHSLIILE